ncbi:helix-turn-helix transcriptional regulator [Caulobacter segnis]|uniref:helix-turn-helix domain-containing protein n=1 Tax=Caulobacter segnis TaxID=88688 RepID=UPI0024103B27|nr:helix-turn-helix transcriptional regulator [Caulobacter segnis]MDG2520447.1 helix-turn-helix transcriptional regulator [Caulobacter segnis]
MEKLAANVKSLRLALGLTQAGLSARSGVPLGTLRKFEQTGHASSEALMKLLIAVGAAQAVIEATEPRPARFSSIDEVLEPDPRPTRKRGWRK